MEALPLPPHLQRGLQSLAEPPTCSYHSPSVGSCFGTASGKLLLVLVSASYFCLLVYGTDEMQP